MMSFVSKLSFPVFILLTIGSLQIVGFITGLDILRDIGRLSAASPLPLVFSEFRGLETFSLDFNVEAEAEDGTVVEKKITPKLYGKFKGPYNRRNVYGAVLAYGAKLIEPNEKPLVDSVLRYGFCKKGPLTGMLGVASPLTSVTIIATSKARDDGGSYVMEVNCQ